MLVQYSSPILVAAATPVVFDLLPRDGSRLQLGVVFYSTADGLFADVIAAGTGTRDLAVTQVLGQGDQLVAFGFAGGSLDTPTATGGNVTALPARTLATFDSGVAPGRITVASAEVVNPEGAVAYRIVVVS